MIFKTSILFSFESGFGGTGCRADDGFIKAIYDAGSLNVRNSRLGNRIIRAVRVIKAVLVDRIFLNGGFLDEFSVGVILLDDSFLHLCSP